MTNLSVDSVNGLSVTRTTRKGDRGPSVTAAVVAGTLLLLREDPDLGHLIDEPALGPLECAVREAVPALDALLGTVPWPFLRRAAFAAEALLSPGFIAHYALRKALVRAELLRAVDDGYRQVVLLGAGFDMLAASVPGDCRVLEVDLPATQWTKRRALAGHAAGAVTYLEADFAVDNLNTVLTASPSFDRFADTVFVGEGLLMYLQPDRVGALLDDLGTHGGARSRAILTVLTPDREGRNRLHTQRKAIDLCMRWLDEPFVWGAPRDGLDALFGAHGLRVVRVESPFGVRDVFLASRAWRRMPRSAGEVVVTVEGDAG